MNLSDDMLEAFLPPEHTDAASWADANCYLSAGGANTGRWKCRYPQREILENMSVNGHGYASGAKIREMAVLKSAQTGFSSMELNAIAYHMCLHPTNMALYLPSNDMARAYGTNQFAKFIAAQPVLDGVIDKEVKSTGASSSVRKRYPGGTFSILSAAKPADLSQHSLKLIWGDEVDSYKETVGAEGDPVQLIYARAREHQDSLIVWGSTPRGGFQESRIWKLYQQSDRRRYFVPCPHCSTMQFLSWSNFIKHTDGIPHEEAGFRCVECGAIMTEEHKHDMLRMGEWRPAFKKEGEVRVPGRVGYHLWAALSETPSVSWPNLSRMHQECGYDKQRLLSFMNVTIGMPSAIGKENDVKPSEILEATAKSTYKTLNDDVPSAPNPIKTIPNEISLICIAVDQQGPGENARLEYSVFGFARGDHIYFLRHSKIHGDVTGDKVWRDLQQETEKVFVTHDGKRHIKPELVLIDSSNGIMTGKIYQECMKVYNWQPLKGHSTPGKRLVVQGTSPLIGPIKASVPLFSINTSLAKDIINDHLKALVSGDPECKLHIPDDLDQSVATAWCSEYRQVIQGVEPKVLWRKRPGMANEALDTFVYALAAKSVCADAYPDQDAYWDRLENETATDQESNEGGLEVGMVFNSDDWY